MPTVDFIHLRVASSYSLAEGAIKITEEKPKDGAVVARNDLISLCNAQDMPAVALTDLGNLFGALEFALAAGDAGIQPIIGCSVALQRQGQAGGGEPQKNGHPVTDRIVLLAMNAGGYQNLVRLVSTSFLAPDRLTPSVTWPELPCRRAYRAYGRCRWAAQRAAPRRAASGGRTLPRKIQSAVPRPALYRAATPSGGRDWHG